MVHLCECLSCVTFCIYEECSQSIEGAALLCVFANAKPNSVGF